MAASITINTIKLTNLKRKQFVAPLQHLGLLEANLSGHVDVEEVHLLILSDHFSAR